ncbi:MAG: hypothetical protein ACN6OP_16955 [Pseudomonadales bacterium]|uniref:hypothetical protein n=1 Tax=Achromobacter marplatensis TaxID=470868 RepID=UPI0028F04BDC|nr:hypothetical protein [Achromobacter marplatensis]
MNRRKMCLLLANTMLAVSILITPTIETAFATGNVTSSDDGPWVTQQFDFLAPALNFESRVPRDAAVELVPMEPNPPNTIGNVKVIGKITSEKDVPKVDTSIVGYNLQAPATALRICTFELEALGFLPSISTTSDDLTEAGLLAQKAESGKPKSAAIGYCFAREKQALGIYFIVDVSNAASMEAANDLVQEVDRDAASFIDSLAWADGQQSSFGGEMQAIPLRIGAKDMTLRIPRGWDIPINDFHGPLPAELHMVRRKDGKDVGLVWLFVQNMKDKPDLATAGAAIVKDYFVKQTADARTPVLLSSEEDSSLRDQGIAARTFRFSVEDKKGRDAGAIDALVAWKNGQLSVLTLWSAWQPSADRSSFFSRLPGLSVYDILRQAVLTTQP